MIKIRLKIAAAVLITSLPISSGALSQTTTTYWGTGGGGSQTSNADCPEKVAAAMNQQTRKAVDQYGSLAQTLYDELQQAKYAEMSCLQNLLSQHPTLSGISIPSLTDLLQQFESAVCNALQTKVSTLESEVQTATQSQSNGYELIPGVNVGQSYSAVTFTSSTTSEQSDATYGVNQADQSLSLLSNAAKYPITSLANSFSNTSE